MRDTQIIGIMLPHESCLICTVGENMPDVANEITMDLLLSRRTAEEIVRYAKKYHFPFYVEPTMEHLITHASHCSSAMVPDDYIMNSDKYEDGERHRLRVAENAAEEEAEHT